MTKKVFARDEILIKPYTLRELSDTYGVDWRTFKKWIKVFENEIGETCGRYYSIPQVNKIIDKLGVPSLRKAT